MTELRKDLPPMPASIAKLPVGENGYPVPWFVAWIDGLPEFRVADVRKMVRAVQEKRCWTCGEPLGAQFTFLIGPMCAVNRISSEPPSHPKCAAFSIVACPFLSRPKMHRREAGLPEESMHAAGVPILRNPGVTLAWTADRYEVFREGTGILFRLPTPIKLRAYTEGRAATPEEVRASVVSGMGVLVDAAQAEGPGAMRALRKAFETATDLLAIGQVAV